MSIASFFSGKTILLTGATGLLAKAIGEKILRDLPKIRQIYLLVRPRSPTEHSAEAAWKRAESEIFQSGIFNRLRRDHGEGFQAYCRSKIACISGDISRSNLGLSTEDFSSLAQEIDIVINSAATVTFDERLDVALETNVFGVSNILDFSRLARAVFVQVSTAYVSGQCVGDVAETIDEPDFDVCSEIAILRDLVERTKALHHVAEPLKRELVRVGMERAKRRGWIDTYTFTKFLGEQWLKMHQGQVPAAIVRPSIIESSLREPEPGWIERLRMADPLLISAGRGLRGFPMKVNALFDLIPLDFVVNVTLAACSYTGSRPSALKVFTVATGSENPLLQGDLARYLRLYYERHPLEPGVSLPKWTFPPLAKFRRALAWRRRLLPIAEKLLAKLHFIGPSRQWRLRVRRRSFFIEQLWSYMESYSGYLTLRSRFLTANTRQLHESLSLAEQDRFGFDVREIDWSNYIQEVHLPGLIRNVLRLPIPAVSPVANAAAERSRRILERIKLNCAPFDRFPAKERTRSQRLFLTLTSWFTHRYLAVECRGLENLPSQGPCIFSANHSSHLDWLAIREVLGPNWPDLYVMGAEDYFFNTPLRAWFFSNFLHVLPFNRQEGIAKSLTLCREILASGRSVLLFPEGTRSVTGELQTFKSGIGVLAVELELPVVPIHVSGTFESLPKGSIFPRPGPVQVRIGAPIDFSSARTRHVLPSPKGLYRQVAAELRERLEALAPGNDIPPECLVQSGQFQPEPEHQKAS